MPAWPCSLLSSSAMRFSSLETVPWRSETAESVRGAIVWMCERSAKGRYVCDCGRSDGRWGGEQWQSRQSRDEDASFQGQGPSSRAASFGRVDAHGLPGPRLRGYAVVNSANDVGRTDWFLG